MARARGDGLWSGKWLVCVFIGGLLHRGAPQRRPSPSGRAGAIGAVSPDDRNNKQGSRDAEEVVGSGFGSPRAARAFHVFLTYYRTAGQ
ncbi:hypothetical protein GCM10027449_19250 [Sinomonas notoginsengisoli]